VSVAPGPSSVAAAIGVTRVARITGLDRAGVEVASAIRPGGHVLQVCNGKGLDFGRAAAGALFEACELWAAERPPPPLVASSTELRAEVGDRLLLPEALGAVDPALEGARIGWFEAEELHSGTPTFVPGHALFCPPAGAPSLGPAVLPWTSNGMGAHPDADAALLHALLELLERDRLARSFPEGLTPALLRARLLAPASLRRAAPRTAALAEAIAARRFAVHLLDATPDGDPLAMPVAAAFLVDLDEGPVPIAAGYACRLDRDDALTAALLEAAQSRLTEIHGAREDVAAHGRDAALPIAEACARIRPARDAGRMPRARARGAREGIRLILGRLYRAGFDRAVAARLPSPEGVHVVRALVPGLLLSELL
jgi:ribosomal protein S12 methylthiotransferase accessory factor